MAARRVAKSAVDWTAFASKVPSEQTEFFRSFKATCDKFAGRVHLYPENLPKIDFDFYKTRLPAAMVDKFQKEYAALKVPYPTDKDNLKKTIDAQEGQMKKETDDFIAGLKQKMAAAQESLDLYDKIPGPDRMTQEMFFDYFPEERYDGNKPSFWPHIPSAQPGNPKHFG